MSRQHFKQFTFREKTVSVFSKCVLTCEFLPGVFI